MYDFHFGTTDQIKQNPEDFLIFVKRMLPRWINGIPDSECISIYRTLVGMDKKDAVLLETGCGASTLAMFIYAVLNNAHIYSWDTNGSKGSFLRSVISEAICRPMEVDLYKYWTFIGFDSTCEHVGIPVISELGLKADFGYFDSWHTLDHLMNEIKCFQQVVNDQFVIALDDAYYTKRTNNFSYLNMIRAKLDLDAVQEPESNVCEPFYIEVGKYLQEAYSRVEKIADSYKQEYRDDIFFNYFSGDRAAMGAVGMEDRSSLDHRYDCWSVSK